MGSAHIDNGERRQESRRLLERTDAGRRLDDADRHQLIGDGVETAEPASMFAAKYVLMMAAVVVIAVVAVRSGNVALAPLLNSPAKIDEVASILASGRNYHTYDLNIETRRLRRQHIQQLDRTPEVAVLGASHWQEGHSRLGRHTDLYNAHVHRDYYEDILAVTGMFVQYGKLPPKMIITIRDNIFTPVDQRTDFLWVPVLADYRKMAKRLGIPAHNAYADGLTPQLRQRVSLPLLLANIERYLEAPQKPFASSNDVHPTLDTLLPDGSILWSTMHNQAFTPERSRELALSFAAEKRNNPPQIDEDGVDAVDTLLSFLTKRGVEVYLAHPPFNPIYWDAVQDSPYINGLERVKQVTRLLANKYNLKIVGGFDPYEVGCRAEQYIDAEHSRPECLAKIVDEFLNHDQQKLADKANRG